MNDKYFKEIINGAEEGQAYIKNPGYYNLDIEDWPEIYNKDSILQQIELRVLNERKCSYSIALNHLVNEIQSICFYLDDTVDEEQSRYRASDVDKFLAGKVSYVSKNNIQNLFKRRNNNCVSHSGIDELLSQGVSKVEYEKYKENVGRCLKELVMYMNSTLGKM